MTIDVKDLYLNTPMAQSEYMCLEQSDLPESVVQQYNLEANATKDGYIHVDIQWGIYGIMQAGIITQELIDKILKKKGYHQIRITPGFRTHKWRPICFALCVDDFGVKHVEKQHAEHLMTVLIKHYKISSN